MNFELRELSAPFGVQLEITGDCNNCCYHCYNYWRDEPDNQEKPLKKEDFLRVVDELVRAKIFYVTITGGEPLLKKEILYAVMEKLAENKIGFSLNSNLVDLTKDDIAIMGKIGLKSVLTSIHSYLSEKHDAMSNHQGSFRATVENISRLVDEGFEVKANMVITSKNYKDVFLTGKLLSQIGTSGFFVTRFLIPVREKDFTKLKPTKKQLIDSFLSLFKAEKEFSLSVGSLVAYPYCFLNQTREFNRFAKRSCNAGITVASVESTGYIRACPNSEIRYGHILKEGLCDSWRKMWPWRKGVYIPQQCLGCYYRSVCRGGCRADGMKISKMEQPDELMNGPISSFPLQSTDLKIADLTENSLFFVNQNIRYRREAFGYAVAGRKLYSPALVSEKVFNFLIKIKDKGHIPIKTVLKEWCVGLTDVRELFSYLAEREVITIKENKERR